MAGFPLASLPKFRDKILANNDLIFRTGGAASNFGVTERFRIANTGVATFSAEVVVGSPTTNATLSISGDNSGGDSFLNFRADNGGIKAQIQGTKFAGTGGQILFKTRQSDVLTEAMRINQVGRLFVGTTLGLTGRIVVSNDATTGISIFDGSSNGSFLRFYNSNAVEVGSVQTNGSSTTYSTTSDYRLKEDFKEINGLDKVLSIKVYDFKFKNSENRMDGVLAHELAEVIPYAVTGEKDAVQENGEIQPQGVDNSLLVPM
jgi:hypothetical protein